MQFVDFSYEQQSNRDNIKIIDTLQTNINEQEKEYLEKRKKIEEQNEIDSLRLDNVLNDALKIANENINKEKFYKKYEVLFDSVFNVYVEINLDYHFTKNHPHLIIHRCDIGDIYIDIYYKNENKFEKVVSHKQWSLTYTSDTIRDINGDGLKDFVVNWYGNTGCCLKAFSNVYLLRSDKKTFSNDFEFINPTFSPKEKIIRGICYGHPGETEMYKYKWNGERIDTLEYVFYEKNDNGEKTGKIIISDTPPNYNNKILKRLNSVPNEYKKIENYDWFANEWY